MSLISESLRKAQLEAMRQDEAQRGTYFRAGRVDTPRAEGSRIGMIFAAAAGAAIAAGGIFLLNTTRVKEPVRVATAPIRASAPQSKALIAPTPTPAAVVTTLPSPAPVAERAAPASKRAKHDTTSRSEPAAKSVDDPPAAASHAVPPQAAEEKKPLLRARDRLVDGHSYASPISAPGGIEVSLSGVSSIGGASVAIMNGAVVREGSTVGPFVVEAIERGRVRLRYIDVHFWLSY